MIIQSALPNNRIIRCIETKDYYFFIVPPRSWNGKGSAPAGGEAEYVFKDTGEHNSMHIGKATDIILANGPDTHVVDITPYLSTEDADFLKHLG